MIEEKIPFVHRLLSPNFKERKIYSNNENCINKFPLLQSNFPHSIAYYSRAKDYYIKSISSFYSTDSKISQNRSNSQKKNIYTNPNIEYEKIVSPIVCFQKHRSHNHYHANKFKRATPKRNVKELIKTGNVVKDRFDHLKPHPRILFNNQKQIKKNQNIKQRQSIELCSFTQNSDSDECLTFISFIENKQ